MSKYKLLMNLIIICFFYFILYGNKIILCMNENTNIIETPTIAEAKETYQMSELKQEIRSFAESQMHLLERIEYQNATIESQKAEIADLTETLTQTRREFSKLINGYTEHREHKLTAQNTEIVHMLRSEEHTSELQ